MFHQILPMDEGRSIAPPEPRCVAFVLIGDMVALDLIGPLEAFTVARAHPSMGGRDPYLTRILSESGGPVATRSGLPIATEPVGALDGQVIDTLIVVGCGGGRLPAGSDAFLEWLRTRASSMRRLCSACTGAFALAEAGLADGKTITTHWRWLDELAQIRPAAKVKRGPIYIKDGNLWTSAGVTAGIDLALALIEEDLGRPVAMDVARTLVVYLNRPGNQEQFSTAFEAQTRADGSIADLITWISSNLHEELSVDALACKASMSPRTLARRFVQETGRTPAKFVEQLRLEAAKRALEDGKLPLKGIARLVGLGDEQSLRRAMLRSSAITPSEYRARFRLL
ncbi:MULTISPECIES: helix-turn-helix domain-containing protein [unclassified Mesorhizobium]|uniref:GlxA family transcriptional regulator n=1 Tax=unclassified Mesorhizobium TaxID=325217 RepID=UPI001AECE806|nr:MULTISPECIES: helix-turn-helix domain-containing protein [unclassified Mesorhizobium]